MQPSLLLSGIAIAGFSFTGGGTASSQTRSYPVVDTGVHEFYNNTTVISAPVAGEAFYGQDATYQGNEPSYTDNGNGTITDNVTGLTWQQEMGIKLTWQAAFGKADTMTLGGYNDWRVPAIRELYSLIRFTGQVNGTVPLYKFIDTVYFNQPLGNPALGERLIDAQTWSSTQYKGLTMNGDTTVFGVNFLDGRIKGYPKYKPGSVNTVPNTMYFRMVRGNPDYGVNAFVNNNDGTVTDNATGLMWQQADDGIPRDWENSLSYAENLDFADHADWRLPSAKELESIIDYSRCPSYTNSPAIDPLFATTMISDPDGNPGQYPYFWTSTSHLDGVNPYSAAVYLAFGKAQGKMNGTLMDVHGAGAQRSDPKTGDPAGYPSYFGPQGDVRYVFNYTRCVRDIQGSVQIKERSGINFLKVWPNPVKEMCTVSADQANQGLTVELYNFMGERICLVGEVGPGSVILNCKGLSRGIYLLKATSGNHVATRSIEKL